MLKFSQDAEAETSESLRDEPPLKAHVSSWDEREEAEQLKNTVEPRRAASVPFGRMETGPMDVDTFSGPPEGKEWGPLRHQIQCLKHGFLRVELPEHLNYFKVRDVLTKRSLHCR